MNLHPDHRADLEKSGITEATIKAAGIYSVPPDQINRILGWNAPIDSLLAFPYGNGFTRFKLFPPLLNKEGKTQKYFQYRNSGLHLYMPPGFDASADCLRLTEGEKKALRGSQDGLNVAALGGIWNFGSKDSDSGLTHLIDDLKTLIRKDGLFELIPDGDYQLKEPVAHAVYRLGTMLEAEGAIVHVVTLPVIEKLDDYLCKYSLDAFLALPRLTLEDPFFRPFLVKEKGLAEAIGRAVMSSSEFMARKFEPRPYYLKPWLRAGALSMIYAARGIGKSFLCISIALAITRQLQIGNWQPGEPAPVLYLDGEMAAEELQNRIRLLSIGLPPEIAPLHILSAEDMQLQGWPVPKLTDSKWREALHSYLKTQNIYRVLILDNIASLAPGLDENDKSQWDEINQFLLSLRWLGIAVVLVHHAGKSGDQRGTSGREDNLDVVIRLSRPAGYRPEDGARFDCEFTKARGVYGEGAAPFSFQLIEGTAGSLTWGTETAGAQTKQLIIALLGNGIPQREIPALLGIQRAWVSKVKKAAIEEGQLTEKGNDFTDTGRVKYGNLSIEGLVGR
jgi:hypothetical protein